MKRLLTALLLLPPVLYVILAGHPLLFLVVATAVGLAGYFELVRITRAYAIDIDGPLGFIAGFLVIAVPSVDLAWFAVIAVLGLLRSLRARELAQSLPQAAAFTLGIAYVCLPWRSAVLLRQFDPHWLLYALALNWVGDMAAYYVGSLAGRHKLAPRISPAKSWEGTAASLVASVLFGVFYAGRFIPQADVGMVIALTTVASVAGQLGDLCESAIKRGAAIKDSGSILPGHGGVLDRVDSSLFTVPVVYFWLSRSSMP
jgi:phosphatidate cytidylyltransferase